MKIHVRLSNGSDVATSIILPCFIPEGTRLILDDLIEGKPDEPVTAKVLHTEVSSGYLTGGQVEFDVFAEEL